MTQELTAEGFSVTLDVFEGPFDVLLSLIAKRKLDITEIALSQVTDEFITYIAERGPQWDLEQASAFLVVAATLLDVKAARLLPQGAVDDEEDLELLAARDLLFARLLQYRAFKQVAQWIGSVLDEQSRRLPRPGGLEDKFAVLLPEVTITVSPDQFAQLARLAMVPPAPVEVSLDHIYVPRVSVVEQANLVASRLQRTTTTTFRALVADAASPAVTVARFLAILELFRIDLVAFEQLSPLGELVIRWVGEAVAEIEVSDEFDQAAAEEVRA